MEYLKYDDKIIDYLKSKDAKLASIIDYFGYVKREINTKPFESLIQQIIAQQVSKQAAKTVFEKLKAKVSDFNAKDIYELSLDDIQSCGMTHRKAGYIHSISEEVINKTLDFDELFLLDDEEVIKKMSKLSGIGKWSAQMFLIFTMQRMNVISYDDLAIRKGMMKLYGLTSLDKKTFEMYKKNYEPYATVASIYLWHLAHNDLEK
ncbi:DNA-3-methyladenine glycosylase II [Bacilli bacterium PM5-3]|nr:DNA-3-methyladenine glycosylase II [Bacilli bacterium PM5-3]MDH6603603.1 DNA-3-methyladenine glycosylase II [Bacilli bacterium PM5-9]